MSVSHPGILILPMRVGRWTITIIPLLNKTRNLMFFSESNVLLVCHCYYQYHSKHACTSFEGILCFSMSYWCTIATTNITASMHVHRLKGFYVFQCPIGVPLLLPISQQACTLFVAIHTHGISMMQ